MILQIKNLTVTHKKDLRVLIEGLSFALNDSDRAVIIGEEGNGKSTLLKLIADPREAEEYVSYTGQIIRGSTRFSYLPQQCTPEQLALCVPEFLFSDGVSPDEVSSALCSFGLPASFMSCKRTLSQLSGGERVRLWLTRLSLSEPDCYLLDEPSNDIDIPSLCLLEDFINDSPVPVLYVSHDETLIENTANAVLHLELVRKKTLPRAAFSRVDYKTYRAARDTALGKQARISAEQRAEFDKKQARLQKIMQKVESAQNGISRGDPHGGRLLKKKMKAIKSQQRRLDKDEEKLTLPPDVEDAVSMDFSAAPAIPSGKTVLELDIPSLRVGNTELCGNIKLHVGGGDKLCIIGNNGCGKTTLLHLIRQRLADRGDIKVGYMPQNYAEEMDGELTPVQFASPGEDKASLTRTRTFLGCMKYTPQETQRKLSQLSGGQKAKLFFVKMILSGCNVMLLDEPTRNLSPLSNPVLRAALIAFPGVIIAASHDRKFITEVCGRILLLDKNGLTPVDGEDM